MKLDSKYFDMIRIHRPAAAERRDAKHAWPCCQWKGCIEPGRYRAPKGRGHDGEFFAFCVEHVRQYNTSYNYFDGMTNAEVENYVQGAVHGHRPTWRVGANAWSHGTPQGVSAADLSRFAQARAANAEGFYAWRARHAGPEPQQHRRYLKPLERRALETLDLPECSDKVEIKARFKALVKLHHPDANGGHRGSEDRLREIIQAYNYLKQAGLV
ncbi:MAG: J domain-containing protein [Hyphomicrobiaceae bacterium]|nr:J domain-containing protein [Hyphomicrobiaceae bacterium]